MRNIESDSKMEERLNGKIYGIGDSINDDTYIESYKNCSKKLQFRDWNCGCWVGVLGVLRSC